MKPTCAICAHPLTKQQKFVLIGTEAAHRACAASGVPSKLVQMTKRVAEIEVAVATLAREARTLEAQMERQERDNLELTRRLADERAAKVIMASTLLVAEDQRREALAECDRLRARIRQLEAPPPTPKAAEVEDAAEARFGLLEFD